MTSGTIFQKTCPGCAAVLRPEDERCECGYVFDADPQVASAAQQAVEEELFEAYLTARVDQALASLLDARGELATAPQNFDKAALVMRRVHELRVLRTDLEAQKTKSATARDLVENLRAATSENQPTDTPTDAFRAAQATRAQQVASPGSIARTCPACHAAAAEGVTRCSCGYRFESALSGGSIDSPRDSTTLNPSE